MTYPRRPLHEILDTDGRRRARSAGDGVSRRDADLRGDQAAGRSARDGARRASASPRAIASASCCRTARSTSSRRSPSCGTARSSSTSTRPTRAREVLIVANDSGMRILVTLDALAPLALGIRERQPPRADRRHLARGILGRGAAPPPQRRRHAAPVGPRSARRAAADVRRASPIDAGRPRGPAVHRRHDRHAERRRCSRTRNIFANVVQTEAFMDRTLRARRRALPAGHPVLPHLRRSPSA